MRRSENIYLSGLRYHYLEFGKEGSPSLVCLHGLTRNANDFTPVGTLFQDRFHVRALDVRGRGDSEWGPSDRYCFAQYVEDLKAALDAWEVERTSLIGTSMGGLISLLFAVQYPELVERLVLNDVGPEVDPRGVARILKTSTVAPEEFRNRNELISYFRSYFPPSEHWADDEVWDFAQSSFRATDRGTWAWKMDPAVRQSLSGEGGKSAAPDLWAELEKAGCPLLVIRGKESDILSTETCARMQRAHPDTVFVEIPGVGHPPLLSEPKAVDALQRFLGHEGTSSGIA